MAEESRPTVPPNVMLAGIVGSTAYGLTTPDSDIDIAGVFAAPTVSWHGFKGPAETAVNHRGIKPDFQFHEIVKFLRLAMKCNPSVIEVLWLDDHLVMTPLGRELVQMRSMFLTRFNVRDAYLGYARQQQKKVLERGISADLSDGKAEKHLRHLMRLLIQGLRLLETGTLRVRLTEEEQELVRAFADVTLHDHRKLTAIVASFETKYADVYSPLPSQVNVRKVEEWLIKVRAHHLLHNSETDFPWPATALCTPSATTFS